MKIALVTSASSNTPWINITISNHLEYCVRHNYTMIVYCESYSEAMENFGRLDSLLNDYDLIWTIDADCLITDLTKKIEEIPELGPNVSICEEGLGPHTLINGGSMVWKNTLETHELIQEIISFKSEWISLTFNIQDWLMTHHQRLSNKLKICPLRTFNSVHHNDNKIWLAGDFVYHPCGAPADLRCQMLNDMKNQIIR